MKVILLKDIKGTGKKDQVIEVSDGFGRNYLLPRKMAIEATAEAVHSIEKSKQAEKHREDVKRDEAEKQARDLKGKVVIVKVRAVGQTTVTLKLAAGVSARMILNVTAE